MTEQQLQIIVSLMSGMQISIVHLANLLAATCSTNPEDIAASFEETANKIPEDAVNRTVIQLVLRQVAVGIRGSGAGEEWNALLSRLLH